MATVTITDAQAAQLQQMATQIVTDQQTYDAAVTTAATAAQTAATADAASVTAAAAVTAAAGTVSADVTALNAFVTSLLNPPPATT